MSLPPVLRAEDDADRREYANRDEIRRHIDEHLRLLDLIEARRMAEAARLTTRHLRRRTSRDAG